MATNTELLGVLCSSACLCAAHPTEPHIGPEIGALWVVWGSGCTLDGVERRCEGALGGNMKT
ncbi:hypothetical protein E2C01_010187 [Portunus trituberculatus]|uniref:Secreted protein n=1 Tax=Portunus trituberculatus TaxID=210409 RepID=A0A5B7D808_PORTR|nr:hypothetical protein [Portunus trituberculatus]